MFPVTYRFEFHPYQRQFQHPLTTHHGIWKVREGIILRLTDEKGRVGWGEIAPLPWFGSETLEQALTFCQQFPSQITSTDIFSIPAELPACQFGFESAWEVLVAKDKGESQIETEKTSLSLSHTSLKYSYLLPTGEVALTSWQQGWQQGDRTFKWKIGVTSMESELRWFDQLVQALPQSAQLRLDANGGLTQSQAQQWLQMADQAGMVEFLEQPLPPEEFAAMRVMQDQYRTAIALDESVATLNQLKTCYLRGWRGIFVIKAAIAGSPKQLRQFCQTHDIDVVFSSVFESAIARQAVLNLATELSHPHRAVGFGVNHWFVE
ncbi:o-succinylbenzoate synthase [Coleofasciculus sp. G3-WIS-01]|uniref:o-succinylbenzoate synthase n=1 Tax=Coleofasciculus sp. G3-WIS-01 TaxID=3069528 RepID=UPI004063819A